MRRVLCIYGVGPNTSWAITEELDSYAFMERVPHLIVPLGSLVHGYRLCIALRPNDYGYIYMWAPLHLWPTEEDGPNEQNEEDLFLIAKSFEEFLAMLKPIADDE